jgi:hypothetical protein
MGRPSKFNAGTEGQGPRGAQGATLAKLARSI